MGKYAEIEVWWVAEINPDLFSRVIMSVCRTPYSHVCILYKGEIYHAIPPKVCKQSIAVGMKGSKAVYRVAIPLDVSEVEFEAYLKKEIGKNYSTGQCAAMVFKFLSKLPLIGKYFINGDQKRVCSEFVGAAVHNNVRMFSKFRLHGGCDGWKPKYLLNRWRPKKVV